MENEPGFFCRDVAGTDFLKEFFRFVYQGGQVRPLQFDFSFVAATLTFSGTLEIVAAFTDAQGVDVGMETF